MIAIGANELGEPVKEGDIVVRHSDRATSVVELGTDSDGKKSNVMQFAKVVDELFLVGINGQLLAGWMVIYD